LHSPSIATRIYVIEMRGFFLFGFFFTQSLSGTIAEEENDWWAWQNSACRKNRGL